MGGFIGILNKLIYIGSKKAAIATSGNDALKIAFEKQAHAKAVAAAKYKASLLMSHGVPAQYATVKTTAGKMTYVVTHAKPVIVKNVITNSGAVAKTKLMLVATGKGFTVKAVPLGVTAAKAAATKIAVTKAGLIALGAGGYLAGLISGAGW